MNIEQKSNNKPQQTIQQPRNTNNRVKTFTPEEEQEFIASLLIDDDEDWTEEDENKYQRVMKRLDR